MTEEPGAGWDAHGYQVPRLLRAAEVLCADGRVLRGRVFLPAAAQSHSGAMRAEEWMNEPARFFPFLPDGEGRTIAVVGDRKAIEEQLKPFGPLAQKVQRDRPAQRIAHQMRLVDVQRIQKADQLIDPEPHPFPWAARRRIGMGTLIEAYQIGCKAQETVAERRQSQLPVGMAPGARPGA